MVCQLRAIFYFFWISHASPVPRLRRISLEIFEQKTHSCRALQARFNLADWLILAQNYSNAILLGCWEVLTSQVSQAQIPNCTPGNTVGTYLYILFRLCDIDAGGCHAVGVARCLVSESHLVSTWMTPFLWCQSSILKYLLPVALEQSLFSPVRKISHLATFWALSKMQTEERVPKRVRLLAFWGFTIPYFLVCAMMIAIFLAAQWRKTSGLCSVLFPFFVLDVASVYMDSWHLFTMAHVSSHVKPTPHVSEVIKASVSPHDGTKWLASSLMGLGIDLYLGLAKAWVVMCEVFASSTIQCSGLFLIIFENLASLSSRRGCFILWLWLYFSQSSWPGTAKRR